MSVLRFDFRLRGSSHLSFSSACRVLTGRQINTARTGHPWDAVGGDERGLGGPPLGRGWLLGRTAGQWSRV